jgi:hypothetical protein
MNGSHGSHLIPYPETRLGVRKAESGYRSAQSGVVLNVGYNNTRG